MQYTDFQNMPASEKIVLAKVQAATRLMGWAVHSGSVYKIENFTRSVVVAVEDSGTAYSTVDSIVDITASKYFHDRENQTIYIQASDSSNPNSRFIVVQFQLFFANVPVVLPHDLASGYDVYFEPLIRSTSEFGVSIDTVAQTSEAIEGSGSLSLTNDHDFWPANFDKISFENQRVWLYSYFRDLDASDARLIFKGKIQKRSYSNETITFQLIDQFAELRSSIPLETIGSLEERTGTDLENAKQRLILGRVYGHVPTNIDQVLDGYPLTGTLSVSFSGTTITGTGTAFLTELSPDDRLVLDGEEYTVATVVSDTEATLTDEYEGITSLVSATAYLNPDQSKRFMNRVFKIAGHALCEPVTTIGAQSTIERLVVADTSDFFAGDTIYIGTLGSGELAIVESVIGQNYLRLATSLATVPSVGSEVRRPAVQNVKIGNVALEYYRDYTLDASTAVLTLRNTAEGNASPVFQLPANITFTDESRVVSGTGFQAIIQPGYMVGVAGNAEFFEVLSVDSDTQLTLRTEATFTSTASGRYKSLIYDHGNMVLSLDALGRTDDGTTSGSLLKTAPSISKFLLEEAGLGAELDSSSFDAAEDIAYQHVGIVIPAGLADREAPSYRDVLNKINKSVFGTLVQNSDFQFSYHVLRPHKITTATKFTEADILSFTLNSTAENAVKTVIIEYQRREYDPLTQIWSISTKQKTSDTSNYLLKTDRTRTISTQLVDEGDAEIMANRWSFLLENSTGILTFTTKAQGFGLQVGDIIEIEHRKFFERFGGSVKRKLMMVESVRKSGLGVRIEATDLSNTFNRVASINTNAAAWGSASATELLYGGFITDQYGLINNDPESFGSNLIW